MHVSYPYFRLYILAALMGVASCDQNGCYPDQNGESLGDSGLTSTTMASGDTGTGFESSDTEGLGEATGTTTGTTTGTSTGTTSTIAPKPICGNGSVETDEQCDDGNDDNLDGCNKCVLQRFVFVTPAAYSGALEGLDGADERCSSLAAMAAQGNAPWLNGKTFKAWLSDSSTSASKRLGSTAFAGDYVKVEDGKVVRVAVGWVGLASETHLSRINRLVAGGSVSGDQHVWTSTNHDGLAEVDTTNCGNWASESGNSWGRFGIISQYNRKWTHNEGGSLSDYSVTCDGERRLYCIEVAGQSD